MNWKSFILGTAVGFISGYAVKELIDQKNISPEKVLDNVKKQFKQHGPISGSWIHMEAESFEKQPIKYRVYKGGISRNSHGANEQYEFVADASTGTLIDVRKFSQE
jgi:predicted small secreted protein